MERMSDVEAREEEGQRPFGAPALIGMPARSGVAPRPAADADARAARVLIVDDEPFVAKALARTLSPHKVTAVQTGKEALALLESESFDIIFCDLMMPNMTGMDLYEAVRASQPGAERRFVFMTGGAFTNRARDFMDRVSNPCADKPFEARLVQRLVAEALTASPANDEGARCTG